MTEQSKTTDPHAVWSGLPPLEYVALPFHLIRFNDEPEQPVMLVRCAPFAGCYGPWWLLQDGSGLSPDTAGRAGWSYVRPVFDGGAPA